MLEFFFSALVKRSADLTPNAAAGIFFIPSLYLIPPVCGTSSNAVPTDLITTPTAPYLAAIDGQFVRLDHQLYPIGCPEFLQHWKSGGHWAVSSPEEIAEKLVFLKENYSSFQNHSIAASQTIRDHFSWRHAAEQAVGSLQSAGFFQWQSIFNGQFASTVDYAASSKRLSSSHDA